MSTTDGTVETETTETVEDQKVEPTEEESKTFDADYVESLRGEAAKHRTKLREQEAKTKELADKLAEIERAQLSEKERLELEFNEAKTKAQTLEAQVRSTLLEAAVAKNVRKFNLEDADATYRLLDASSVDYGDDGRPTNIEEVLAATLERYPFLKSVEKKSAPVVDDPGTTSPGKPRNGGGLTRESVKNMSESERQRRMPEIMEWAARGYK